MKKGSLKHLHYSDPYGGGSDFNPTLNPDAYGIDIPNDPTGIDNPIIQDGNLNPGNSGLNISSEDAGWIKETLKAIWSFVQGNKKKKVARDEIYNALLAEEDEAIAAFEGSVLTAIAGNFPTPNHFEKVKGDAKAAIQPFMDSARKMYRYEAKRQSCIQSEWKPDKYPPITSDAVMTKSINKNGTLAQFLIKNGFTWDAVLINTVTRKVLTGDEKERAKQALRNQQKQQAKTAILAPLWERVQKLKEEIDTSVSTLVSGSTNGVSIADVKKVYGSSPEALYNIFDQALTLGQQTDTKTGKTIPERLEYARQIRELAQGTLNSITQSFKSDTISLKDLANLKAEEGASKIAELQTLILAGGQKLYEDIRTKEIESEQAAYRKRLEARSVNYNELEDLHKEFRDKGTPALFQAIKTKVEELPFEDFFKWGYFSRAASGWYSLQLKQRGHSIPSDLPDIDTSTGAILSRPLPVPPAWPNWVNKKYGFYTPTGGADSLAGFLKDAKKAVNDKYPNWSKKVIGKPTSTTGKDYEPGTTKTDPNTSPGIPNKGGRPFDVGPLKGKSFKLAGFEITYLQAGIGLSLAALLFWAKKTGKI